MREKRGLVLRKDPLSGVVAKQGVVLCAGAFGQQGAHPVADAKAVNGLAFQVGV